MPPGPPAARPRPGAPSGRRPAPAPPPPAAHTAARRFAMAQDLLESVTDGVAVLTLNRPDRLNAMSVPMLDALLEALPRLADDPEVGGVVLTGAGGGFCGGGDAEAVGGGGG